MLPLSAQIVLYCMDFALNELLHNRKLPSWYNSCELFDRKDLSGFRVISKPCLFRTSRASGLTAETDSASKLSLNHRDIKVQSSYLQKVLALFCKTTILNTKQLYSTRDRENRSSHFPDFRTLARRVATATSIRDKRLSSGSGAKCL